MAIDPNIPLQVRPAQFADPLESYAKIAGVRNMIQQQQIGAEKLKSEQLANQETQRSQAAQKTLADLVSKNTIQGGNGEPQTDHFAVIKGLTEAGHAKEASAYDAQRRADLTTELSNAKAKLDIAKQQTTAFSNILGPVAQAPPDKAPDLYAQARQQAIQSGLIKPQDAPEQYDPAFVNQHFQAAVDADKQIDNHQKTLEFAQKVVTEAPKTAKEWTELALNQASGAQSQADLDNTRQVLKSQNAPPEILAQIPAMWSQSAVDSLAKRAMTPEQRAQEGDRAEVRKQTAIRDANIKTNEEAIRKIRQQNANTQAGHLAETKRINAMEYGPDQIDNWVKNLQDNPDSVKELPPKLRSTVSQKFRDSTGLPLPTPLTGQSQIQETAARNALEGVDFINSALKNPEIRKQIGPIMGRLGNAEQSVGTAVGLSPEAEKLAQELRTRMRYFVFQEGKAVLGGRLPAQLMGQLESSTANPKMDPDMLQGALNGAQKNAESIMDNADRQRFGGKMRPRSMRSGPGSAAAETPASNVEVWTRDASGKLVKK